MARQDRSRGGDQMKVYRSFTPSLPRETKRRTQQPSQIKLPQLWRSRVRLVTGATVAVILLWVTYVPRIRVAPLLTDDTLLSSQIEVAGNEYLSANPLRHFQLFISSNELAKAVQDKVPTVERVVVKRALFSHTVNLHIVSKQPSIIWQQGRGGPAYLVDQQGRVLAKATNQEKLPRIISETPPLTGEMAGRYVVDAATIQTVRVWSSQLSTLQLTLDYAVVANVPRQVELSLKDKPFRVRVATDVPVEKGVQALRDSLQKIAEKTEVVNEYVDVRIPHRVYYK